MPLRRPKIMRTVALTLIRKPGRGCGCDLPKQEVYAERETEIVFMALCPVGWIWPARTISAGLTASLALLHLSSLAHAHKCIYHWAWSTPEHPWLHDKEEAGPAPGMHMLIHIHSTRLAKSFFLHHWQHLHLKGHPSSVCTGRDGGLLHVSVKRSVKIMNDPYNGLGWKGP